MAERPHRLTPPPDSHLPVPSPQPRSWHRGTYITLSVKVKLDPSGFGTFSTPSSAVIAVQDILDDRIPHYEPKVSY
jgi:hypothetical protein